MYSTSEVCVFDKTQRKEWPQHIQPPLYNPTVFLSILEASEILEYYKQKRVCSFLHAHPTHGICIYECRGVGEAAENMGCIKGTEGFYFVLQDAIDPLYFLALARAGPSNIVTAFEYDKPFQIDLNPPPHDKTTGLYHITASNIQLVKPHSSGLFRDGDNPVALFKKKIYYIHGGKLYMIENINPKPYKNDKLTPASFLYSNKRLKIMGVEGETDTLDSI